MPAWFVTGTDTGIGKTAVCNFILRQWAKQGKSCLGLKPIASGVESGAEGNEDALKLMQASNVIRPYAQVNPYCFDEAIAPHLAARHVDITIDLPDLQQQIQTQQQFAENILVEGVGGWCVPLTTEQGIADLALLLAYPVILVVGMRLGCLNHALLSVKAIQESGLPLTGWVANCIEPELPFLQENISSLEQRISAPLLMILPWIKSEQASSSLQKVSILPAMSAILESTPEDIYDQ